MAADGGRHGAQVREVEVSVARREPTEEDIDLAVTAQTLLGTMGLRRAVDDEPTCGSCRHRLDPDADLAYCWHPQLRTLVDRAWRCGDHVPDDDV